MTNNIVLDVAIGLIFIYTLYSLLATTINEFIATIFSYRGRMLERGLEQMLDGKNYSFYWWDKLFVYARVYLKELFSNFKTGYDITVVPDKAVIYCRDPENATLDSTKFCKKATLFATAVTGHELYKRSSENSLLSKKPAYLTAAIFADILIDVLTPNTDGNPVLLKDIKNTIAERAGNEADPLNEGVAKILNIYAAQANGDIQKFRALVEAWYAETMNRVSGWYKKQTFRVLLIIGFVLAVMFNVSTIKIVQKLSTDKTLREAMIKSATTYVEQNKQAFDNIVSNAPNTTSIKNEPNITADTLSPVKTEEELKAGLQRINDIYNTQIKVQNVALGLGWDSFGYQEKLAPWQKKLKALKVEMAKVKNVAELEKFRSPLIQLYKDRPEPIAFWEKLAIIFTLENILGFIITALAISLGAPFWFDLLNKFINLRASGAKPAETASTANSARRPSPNSYA